MKTLRHNIYNKVHSELRTLMLDAGLRIQRTDFSDSAEAEKTIGLIREVVNAYEHHAQNEDSHIFHAVASSAPYIIAMFEKATSKNLQLGITIAEMADQFETLRSRNDRIRHGSYLQNVFFEFTATVLQSMNKEETVVNELLWSAYTDKEIVALEQELMMVTEELVEMDQDVVPGELGSTKNGEFAKWISGIFENATPYLTSKLSKMARNIIPPDLFPNAA